MSNPADNNASPRRDNTSNRKWVRQMTKRLKDFMTSGNNESHEAGAQSQQASSASNDYLSNMSRNFGIALERCESSSVSQYVPVVVELCTRLIELHINDEGIYRKVGQKQVCNENGALGLNVRREQSGLLKLYKLGFYKLFRHRQHEQKHFNIKSHIRFRVLNFKLDQKQACIVTSYIDVIDY